MVVGKVLEMVVPYYRQPIKTKKHNIGTEEAPNMAIIEDYWDKKIVTELVYLLKEYEYMFPWSFS